MHAVVDWNFLRKQRFRALVWHGRERWLVVPRRCGARQHRSLRADAGVVLRSGRWWGLRDVPEQDDRHGLLPSARAREPQPQGELALLLAQRVRFERVERKRGELVRGEREQQRGDAGLYDHDGVPAGVRLERDPVPVAEAVAVVPGAAGVAVERGCGGGGRAGADAGAAGDVRQSVCVVLPARERDVQRDARDGGNASAGGARGNAHSGVRPSRARVHPGWHGYSHRVHGTHCTGQVPKPPPANPGCGIRCCTHRRNHRLHHLPLQKKEQPCSAATAVGHKPVRPGCPEPVLPPASVRTKEGLE